MKRTGFIVGVALLAGMFFAFPAMATVINPLGGDGANSSLQDVINGITTLPTPGASGTNVNTDQVVNDAYWSVSGSGGSISTMIIQLAGNASTTTFGVFNGIDFVPLFTGNVGAGAQVMLGIGADGSVFKNFLDTGVDFSGNVFGYYIESNGGLFRSDTTLNSDGFDHMVAFEGTGADTVQIGPWAPGVWGANEFILGFEDTRGGGDYDYQDLVVMVESVNPAPVPEPGTMMLLGSGLVGLAGWGRKKFRK